MKPNKKYTDLGLEFWANIKLLNQRLGYFERKTKKNSNPNFVIPTIKQVKETFDKEGLDYSKLIDDNKWTDFGKTMNRYFRHRKKVLNEHVEPNLLNAKSAKALFRKLKKELKPKCPLPMNKQKGKKKDFAFFTGIINMLIEANANDNPCNYDPMELTAITVNNFPVRTLSRRVDGAFPTVINPIAIWEIKEYYYTTTFGSRVADGVYETLLDGFELKEAEKNINRKVKHYLMVDDHLTWWKLGRSYLCRIIDMLHMGFIDEALFGQEVVNRLPTIVKEWTKNLK
ncbi:MAG: hypothetical protein IH948_09440 [Bacteroidetes bacterium]|nr:hypothetical protein [Bacteroidota bacterium]